MPKLDPKYRVHYPTRGKGVRTQYQWDGKWKTRGEWAEIMGTHPDTIKRRIDMGFPLNQPVQTVYCVGGPLDGGWYKRSFISGYLDVGVGWVASNIKDGVFYYRDIYRSQQEVARLAAAKHADGDGDCVYFPSEGEACDPLLSQFASMRFACEN